MLYLGKVISLLFLPPGLCAVSFFLGMIFLLIGFKNDKARSRGTFLVVLGAAIFIVCSLNPVADFLIRPLEDKHPALPAIDSIKKEDYRDCFAVVILGGGNIDASPEEGTGKSSPSPTAIKRIAYGVRLSRALDLPIIFSGGVVYPHQGGEAEAPAADRYIRGLGIDPSQITLDAKSRDTWENARNVKRIIMEKMPGSTKVILVSSAFHMQRAAMSLARHGITVVPAPTDYHASRVPLTWEAWFPNIHAMEKSYYALHEYLGLLRYSMRSETDM